MDDITLNEKIADASKTIFNYCMAKTPTREDAEDLSQDILFELVKSAKNIRDDGAFYGFMWAVAGNVYKQWYRKKLMRQESELTDNIAAAEEDKYFAEDEGDDIYLLRRELTLLAQKYRRATILYYIDRKSCSEIAEILSVSESMVKYLLFKSRKILKEGMNMERKLGELSYNPKSLTPMYMGSGPNCFWDFMQSKIRQNIVGACYNDALTPEQISLETGIPLPYLDDEIAALEDKRIIVKDGTHYKTNVVIITADCANEIQRSAVEFHEKIADKIGAFIDKTLEEYRNMGFHGADFSENTLRWQLSAQVLRQLMWWNTSDEKPQPPVTAWGDKAFLYCVENAPEEFYLFNTCTVGSKNEDALCFLDYLPKLKNDHHDFYGNERYINIFCDIARGNCGNFSEYDLEAVAEMIRGGYVVKDGDGFKVTVPVYTKAQGDWLYNTAREFIENELADMIGEIDMSAAKILSEHTPKHLQDQVAGIASTDKEMNTVTLPAQIMLEKGYLHTNWHANEMPGMFVVLAE